MTCLNWIINCCRQCLPGSLSPEKVKGKIVLCIRGNGTRVGKGLEVKRAGGAGFILGNSQANGAELTCDPHLLPATAVTYNDAVRIWKYINSTKNPMATIIPAKTVLYTKPAPFMTAFTSRGPNSIDPNILKVIILFSSTYTLLVLNTPHHHHHLGPDSRTQYEFNTKLAS
jgi:hypothetical protein